MASPRMPILRGTVVEGPVKVLEPDAGVRTPVSAIYQQDPSLPQFLHSWDEVDSCATLYRSDEDG